MKLESKLNIPHPNELDRHFNKILGIRNSVQFEWEKYFFNKISFFHDSFFDINPGAKINIIDKVIR